MQKIAFVCAFGVQVLGLGMVTPAAAETEAVSAGLAPDPAKLTMPVLAFTATPQDALDYDKFFYFHRGETGFPEAYADIKECDSLASGVSYYGGGDSSVISGAVANYGMAGAVGGAIGSALADAIFGSAERRRLKRISLRNCMGFKGYARYGLSQDLWKKFNFEEGLGRKKEDVREEAMELQALVASGPQPQTKELGL